MEEIWKDLEFEGIQGWKISNLGRIMTSKGKIKKPEAHTTDLCDKINVHVELKQIHKKKRIRKIISVGHWVYKLFSDKQPPCENFNIFHKDGNPFNNTIDNLKCGCRDAFTHDEKNLDIFKNDVYKCVKHYLHKSQWLGYEKKGFDIDNVIQESVFNIWKYLYKYEKSRSFYSFCKKYTKMCAIAEYNKWIKYPMQPIYSEKDKQEMWEFKYVESD